MHFTDHTNSAIRAEAPAPRGEINALAGQLQAAQDSLRTKIQALDERIAGVSRPPKPVNTEAVGDARPITATAHGRWLQEMVAKADAMADHVQDMLDRIEL